MRGIIRLNNGTEFNGTAVEDEDILWLDLAGTTLPAVCDSFLDTDNVAEITVNQNGVTTVYNGYTHLFYVRETTGVKVSAGIEKGEQDV